MNVRPLSFSRRWFWYGFARWPVGLSRRRRIAALAAGPAVSVCEAVGYAAASSVTSGFVQYLLFWLAVGALWQLACTAIPINYGRFFGEFEGRRSDGAHIRELLRKRPDGITAAAE